ncbi:MAG: hypothetical protein GXO74_07340 [Calditrichaeota bacterium]|nr:hypothetical protein [Calditrichota bacterium]
MQKHFDCVGFGICAADYLCLVPKYPKLDEKTETVEFSKQGGGPCATALVALARLGFDTSFIGKIGTDGDGDFVINNFRAEGVDTTAVIRDKKMPTNKAFIWIDQVSGKKSIVLDSHRYQPVEPRELKLDFVRDAAYVLIDGRDTAATWKIIDWARARQIPIVLDAGSPRREMEKLLRAVDYAIVSHSFCHQFFQTDNYEIAIRKLLDFGVRTAVVTCGEKGSYGGDEKGVVFQPAFQVKVVDTTGAGDVFHGAFVAGLLRGLRLEENLRSANAMAAIKCQTLGGQKGIPKQETVLNFMRFNDSTR